MLKIHGPKFNPNSNSISGPVSVESNVVNQGEWLNQDSYQFCCISCSLFCFSSPSFNFSMEFWATSVRCAYTQHSSLNVTQRPPCYRKIRFSPLLFWSTTSDKDCNDSWSAVIDFSICTKSSSTISLSAWNPWFCCTREVIPVSAPASPRVIKVAIVRAVKGSLLWVLWVDMRG